MNDDASAKRPKPKNFPAAIPRTMTTEAQRAAVESYAEERGFGLGEAVRALVADGLYVAEEERYGAHI